MLMYFCKHVYVQIFQILSRILYLTYVFIRFHFQKTQSNYNNDRGPFN